MPVFRAEWRGLKKSFDFLMRLGATAEQVVGPGVGRAAIRTQENMRGQLENVVYAQPSSPSGYQRTRTLMRSVHAAAPSADHSADEGRASGGADLAASSPESVVEASGGIVASDIGSWIGYAGYVHDGVNQPQPRPFMALAVPGAEAVFDTEIMMTIWKAFATAPHG